MKFDNLSNGESDGFVIFYIHNKKLKTVLLDKTQATTLDMMLQVVFAEKQARVVDAEQSEINKYFGRKV